jgi:hypothetical protein
MQYSTCMNVEAPVEPRLQTMPLYLTVCDFFKFLHGRRAVLTTGKIDFCSVTRDVSYAPIHGILCPVKTVVKNAFKFDKGYVVCTMYR